MCARPYKLVTNLSQQKNLLHPRMETMGQGFTVRKHFINGKCSFIQTTSVHQWLESQRLWHHPQLTCNLPNYIQKVSCFGLGAGVWFIARPIFTTFQLSSLVFSTTLHTWFGLPHPSIAGIFQCVCTHPIDLMGIHLLHCGHGNERTRTHDVICSTFATIVQDVSFHMGQKQLHAFPSTTFNSFCWWHSHLN
jgi:hypothetical protein